MPLLLGQHVQLLFEAVRAGGAVVAAALCALTCINTKSLVVTTSLPRPAEAGAAAGLRLPGDEPLGD